MKASELREKSVKELGIELITLSKQQFNSRMQKSSGLMQKWHQLKATKQAIARVKTILNEKRRHTLPTEEKDSE